MAHAGTTKKLIEVALPLEAINKASQAEKINPFIKGHPRSFHQYWARRPLAAARAVIFAQMVDDPTSYVDELLSDNAKVIRAQRALNERLKAWEQRKRAFDDGVDGAVDPGPKPTLDECATDLERQRLFGLIEQLVQWENTTNESVLQQARDEIWKSWRRTCAANKNHPRAAELFNPDKLPAFHDPFAGGGAIPLEAQRLGLESYASDLNPLAVLINKAMIELPPKFAGNPPVNPEARKGRVVSGQQWKGAAGLAEDVRYYGQWVRDEAEKRIGHLYPKVEVTAEMAKERTDLKPYVGKKRIVIAWLWARTVKSPNPAFRHVDVPLASTFMLSTKAGKEAYVEPVIEGDGYRFTVRMDKPKDAEATKNGTKLARGANFRCVMSEMPIGSEYIKAEGQAGRMSAKLMAIVIEGERGRVYLSPTAEHEAVSCQAQPEWEPETSLPDDPRNFWTVQYGLTTFGDLFTPRQLVALNTFADLVQEVRKQVRRDALAAGLSNDERGLNETGNGATAYAEMIMTYLAMATSRWSDNSNSITSWNYNNQNIRVLFTRQSIPMSWDYLEVSPLGSMGSWVSMIENSSTIISKLQPISIGHALQLDAKTQDVSKHKIISSDPPYYDNVAYADLSDFFYVWLRRSLGSVFPKLFATLTVPKADELVATPYRHGSKEAAEAFFLNGMRHAMNRLAEQTHPAFPVTIYYAFKQSEAEDNGTYSTGWETFLEAVLQAGLTIAGTWPLKTEKTTGTKVGVNALASSIVLVCHPRSQGTLTVTRRDFMAALKAELPRALRLLQAGNIAPVDLAQAAIGPGMAVFTRYGKVIDASGKALGVRDALALINQTLDEVLAEQEGEFDAETRWALAWFDEHGFADGEYGRAETLSKAKNTSVAGMVEAGILASKGGKVRLLKPEEMPADWNPDLDFRLTVWEMVHHLVRVLGEGEEKAAALLAKLGARADAARELAYRLYAVCERKKRAGEALNYNSLVRSWPQMLLLAGGQLDRAPMQQGMDL